jgi:hypothetical protein
MFSLTSRLSLIISIFSLGGLLALGSSAEAATTYYAKFYNGTTGYTGTYDGSGTVYANTENLSTNCPSVGTCSSDNVTTTQTYNGLAVGITASTNGTKVWDDLTPSFGGLGVGTGSPGSSDNIGGTDVLTLTFASKVTLTGVATLFDSAHAPFGYTLDPSTSYFLLSVDGGSFTQILFSNANNQLLSITGTVFAFKEASWQPEFYVSALSYEKVSTTPIPGALPLFATGFGGMMGLLRWRKKRKAAHSSAVTA